MKTTIRLMVVISTMAFLNSCCVQYPQLCKNLQYSVIGGATYANQAEDSPYGNYGDEDNSAALGMQAGALVSMPVKENLSLGTGLAFSSKGSKSENEGDGADFPGSKQRTTLTYLEVPLLARYQFSTTGFNAYSGFQPALLLGARQKYEYAGQPTQNSDAKDRFRGFDTSFVLGVGYAFGNGVNLNLGYDLGLINIANKANYGNTKIRNRALELSLGYSF